MPARAPPGQAVGQINGGKLGQPFLGGGCGPQSRSRIKASTVLDSVNEVITYTSIILIGEVECAVSDSLHIQPRFNLLFVYSGEIASTVGRK
jgi:hypothetical protein